MQQLSAMHCFTGKSRAEQTREQNIMSEKKKRLRSGYTTGSCAAAAAKGAAQLLLADTQTAFETETEVVEIMTPKGIKLKLSLLDRIVDKHSASCAVRKDSGDDPDITNGILIYAKVKKIEEDKVIIIGGKGIGRVTKPGLEQPVGSAAINRVPRQMIQTEVLEIFEKYGYHGGMEVVISIPKGEELAEKTFNPKLGIEGGLSVLGTSGIVEPMSERALIESIHLEMKVKAAEGMEYLLVSPGNYGAAFSKEMYGIDLKQALKCSNYIGETVDMAAELSFKGILFISHIGKFIKVAGGIMNTHSRNADCRMELFVSNALLAGAGNCVLKKILEANTTDEAVHILKVNRLLERTMENILQRAEEALDRRAYGQLEFGIVLFSNQYGILGKTKKAEELLQTVF